MKKTIGILLATVLLCVGVYTAFASPCAHRYGVVSFADNTAHLRCVHCHAEQTLSFADCVDAADYNPALDYNADGFVNGRDLAYLKHHPDGWLCNPSTGAWEAAIELD